MFAEETCTEFNFDNLQSTKLAEFIISIYSFQTNFAEFFFETDLYWLDKTLSTFDFAICVYISFEVSCKSLFQHLYMRKFNIYRKITNDCILLKKCLYYIDLMLWLNCSRRNSWNLFLRLEPFKKKIVEFASSSMFFCV